MADKGTSFTETRISNADVMPGDILLLQYVPAPTILDEAKRLLGLMYDAVGYWWHWKNYSDDERAENFRKLGPLIDWAITVFDRNRYFHAAIVGLEGDEKIVVEAGTSGIQWQPLSDYRYRPVTVVRFHKGAVALGDPSLPAAPVVAVADRLRHDGKIAYGYFHAGLLAIWCLFRDGEGAVLETVKAALDQLIGEKMRKLLFTLAGGDDAVRLLLVDLFQRALDHLRKDHELVCSETVAVCFNDADDKGTYHISRQTVPVAAPASAPASTGSELPRELEADVRRLGQALADLEPQKHLRSVEVAMALVNDSVLYTPSDLERSVSTFLLGDMDRPTA
ncbi:MAG: hypothetical protein EP335_09110 [Alphaproteobacteria bacterium]|nr:MAG: hypothetical protein EP335_09110 [Alphaproteobacteria bacterium]